MITNQTFALLEELEKISGNNDKIEFLKKHYEYLRCYFDIALNPYRVYGIKKFNKIGIVESNHKYNITHPSLDQIATYLENLKGIKDTDRGLVQLFLDRELSLSPLREKWCKKALFKESVCKIGVKLANKAGYNIPEFNCLLAAQNKDNDLSNVKFPAIAQEKLDGIRCIYIPAKGFFGRNGKLIKNQNLENHFKLDHLDDIVLDGELYSEKRHFQDIISIVISEDKEIPNDIKFIVFDQMDINEWINQKCKNSYSKRFHMLCCIIGNENLNNVELIKWQLVDSEKEVIKFYEKCIDNGLEGAMVKDLEALYQWKRVTLKSGILTKLKPSDQIDGCIVGYFEGKGENKGRLGGFIIKLEDKTELKVGCGFTEKQRIDFFKRPEQYISEWILINYTEKTKDGNLRFPVFKGFRDSKD